MDVGVLSGTSFFPLSPAVNLPYTGTSQYFTYQGVNDTLAIVDSGTANLRLSGGVTANGGTSNSVSIVWRPGRPPETRGSRSFSATRATHQQRPRLPEAAGHSGSTGPPTLMSDSFTFSALNFSAERVSFSRVASNSGAGLLA